MLVIIHCFVFNITLSCFVFHEYGTFNFQLKDLFIKYLMGKNQCLKKLDNQWTQNRIFLYLFRAVPHNEVPKPLLWILQKVVLMSARTGQWLLFFLLFLFQGCIWYLVEKFKSMRRVILYESHFGPEWIIAEVWWYGLTWSFFNYLTF